MLNFYYNHILSITLYLQRKGSGGTIFVMIKAIMLKDIDATTNRRLALLIENFCYVFRPRTKKIDELIVGKIIHTNYENLPMNHNYIIYKRPINTHNASIFIKQVFNWCNVAIPG